ncbi:nuclease-related domain-containing protein [Lapillicoccus jejuensis]|uniref:nuclease-related domain-containing protein n=1 Tax=Lapillicoccus jejuensis TaxID=402171 RepID=UPI001477208C|nr:nuclease-related domain-containing protein [Lapillicoccus jejuensis]
MTEQVTSGGRATSGAGGSARAQAAYWSRRAEQSHRDYLQAREKAGRWRVGAEGEEAVAQLLGSFPLELAVLHDRLLEPGRSRVNLDHVVVTNAGVFVLDTKSWSGDVSVSDDTLWVHSDSRRYGRNKDLATVGGYADVMAARLRVQVTPLLVLARDHHQGLEPAFVAGVHVVPAQRLREWFLRRPVVMDDIQSGSLFGVCAREFPDATTTTVVSRPAPARGDVSAPPPGHPRRSRAPRATRRPSPRRRPAARRGMPVKVLIVLMCVLLGPPLAMGVGSLVAVAVTAVVARPAPSQPRPTPSHEGSHPTTPPASTRPAHPLTGTSATP